VDLLRRGRRHRRALAERPGRYRRVAAVRVLVGVLAGAVLAAPAASAHVTVNPREATKGGYAALAFRVPNERDNAGTTELRVDFTEAVFPTVRVKPKTGWTYEVEMAPLDEPIPAEGEQEEITEAVSTITWTGSVIQPGEFEEFEVSLGPLPEDADQIMFPAIQTYEPVANAEPEVVEWIEEPPAEGAEEPERPAPLLTLVDEEEEGSAGAAAAGGEAAGLSVENTASQDDVDSANTLAIVGLLVGLLGVATGAVALFRGRRPAAAATTSTATTTTDEPDEPIG
jgi:periplasmic copper chaperone A